MLKQFIYYTTLLSKTQDLDKILSSIACTDIY